MTRYCLMILAVAAAHVHAQDGQAVPYATMAPIEQYRIASRDDEIAMARSAAPPSIAADADVLVLGEHGYETAAHGKNGFVCIVERSWADPFEDPEFWSPKVRSPNCFNAPAAHAVLPQYLKRTEWALAGLSKKADDGAHEERTLRQNLLRARTRRDVLHALQARPSERQDRPLDAARDDLRAAREAGPLGRECCGLAARRARIQRSGSGHDFSRAGKPLVGWDGRA